MDIEGKLKELEKRVFSNEFKIERIMLNINHFRRKGYFRRHTTKNDMDQARTAEILKQKDKAKENENER